MSTALYVQPGDVMVVIATNGLTSRLIRLGALLRNKPSLDSHVAIFHHYDAAGTPWALEGRPGGVGWVDATAYLASPYTLTNVAQPKTDAQRLLICQTAPKLLGTPYDWCGGIAEDVLDDLGWEELGRELDRFWHDKAWDSYGQVPGHVVCSSYAAWTYHHIGLAAPNEGRGTKPEDWGEFILDNRYQLLGAA